MHIQSVLEKCKSEGYPMTRMGIYDIGKKVGFITKIEGKNRYDFNKEKFLEWLEQAKRPIPEGWITLREASVKFNISIAQAYILSRRENCIKENFGSGRGVTYVDSKRFEEIINENRSRNKIKWEE